MTFSPRKKRTSLWQIGQRGSVGLDWVRWCQNECCTMSCAFTGDALDAVLRAEPLLQLVLRGAGFAPPLQLRDVLRDLCVPSWAFRVLRVRDGAVEVRVPPRVVLVGRRGVVALRGQGLEHQVHGLGVGGELLLRPEDVLQLLAGGARRRFAVLRRGHASPGNRSAQRLAPSGALCRVFAWRSRPRSSQAPKVTTGIPAGSSLSCSIFTARWFSPSARTLPSCRSSRTKTPLGHSPCSPWTMSSWSGGTGAPEARSSTTSTGARIRRVAKVRPMKAAPSLRPSIRRPSAEARPAPARPDRPPRSGRRCRRSSARRTPGRTRAVPGPRSPRRSAAPPARMPCSLASCLLEWPIGPGKLVL